MKIVKILYCLLLLTITIQSIDNRDKKYKIQIEQITESGPTSETFFVNREETVKDLMDRYNIVADIDSNKYDVTFKLGDMELKLDDPMSFILDMKRPRLKKVTAIIKEKLPTTPIRIQ